MPVEDIFSNNILHIMAYIGIVIGLIECLWGYKYFKLTIFATGLIGGFLGGYWLVINNQQNIPTALLTGLIGVLVGVGVLHLLYRAAIFMVGGVVGGLLGYAAYIFLSIDTFDPYIIPVIFGFFSGLIALKYSKEIIVVITAFSGAEIIVQASYFLSFDDYYKNLNGQSDIINYLRQYPAALTATFIIGMVGTIYQFRDRLNLKKILPANARLERERPGRAKAEKAAGYKQAVKKLLNIYDSLDEKVKSSFLEILSDSDAARFVKFYTRHIKENNDIDVEQMEQSLRNSIFKLHSWLAAKNQQIDLKVFEILKPEEKKAIFQKLGKPERAKIDNLLKDDGSTDLAKLMNLSLPPAFTSLMSEHRSDFFELQQQVLHNQQMSQEQMHNINQQMFQQQIQQQFNQFAVSEAMKAVTPFDHGGHLMGPGFNPSDTMSQEAIQGFNDLNTINDLHNMEDMNSMNDLHNMEDMNSMNDMHNMEDMNSMNDHNMDDMNSMNDMHNTGGGGMNGF